MITPRFPGPRVRRLAALLLAVVLTLGALAWQIDVGRGRMLSLLENELAAMRQRPPTPAQMAVVRSEFDHLRSMLGWQLRAAAALGLLGTGLAIALVLTASPVRHITYRLNADFRTVSVRR